MLEGRFSPLGISIILDLSLTLEKIECGFALVHSDDTFFGNGIKAREHTHMMSVVVEGGGLLLLLLLLTIALAFAQKADEVTEVV